MKLFKSKQDVDLVSENRFLKLENMMLKQQLKLMQEDIDALKLKLMEYQINRELKGGDK
jgi:regulator of replication initiation timing